MKIISIISVHPGSGQTTVLVNLASGLVRQGKRVLIGEVEPSPILRNWLGIEPHSDWALNSSANLDDLQFNICSSRLGMDLLSWAASLTDHSPLDLILTSLEKMGYDYLLFHPATAQACHLLPPISDQVAVCTDLRHENELSELQALQEKLQAAGSKSQGISLIIPNRIETKEWEHNSRQIMAVADYFGVDMIADPIPT